MSRIVIDARESGTSTGRYIDKLIEYLHKLNPEHQFIILTKKHRMDFFTEVAPRFTVVETVFKEFSFGEQLGFKKQIESLKPDLVHFGMVQQPVFYKGRVVTTMHDLTTVRFRNPSKNPVVFTLKQLVYKWVNKRVARKSDIVLTPTQFVKEDVIDYTHIHGAQVQVTYEAADKIPERAEPIKKLIDKPFIMYVGRPLPHKNLGRLIDAFALMQQMVPELRLVLAGKKDALMEAHAARAKELGLHNIVFTGFVTEGELRWLYEHTACYVVPSLSEGFGLPGLEAMMNGAPVASSKFSCLPEVYGDAALYFDPTKVEMIGECVLRVVQDAKVAERLRTRGRAQANTYSWERMARGTLEAYERAL